MKIDISKLSASELDELITQAAECRANMQPEHSKTPPEHAQGVVDPAWFTVPIASNNQYAALSIRHPGLGWLTFAIPPHEIANLVSYWVAMLSAASVAGQSAPIATTPASGGGTVH